MILANQLPACLIRLAKYGIVSPRSRNLILLYIGFETGIGFRIWRTLATSQPTAQLQTQQRQRRAAVAHAPHLASHLSGIKPFHKLHKLRQENQTLIRHAMVVNVRIAFQIRNIRSTCSCLHELFVDVLAPVVFYTQSCSVRRQLDFFSKPFILTQPVPHKVRFEIPLGSKSRSAGSSSSLAAPP